MKMSLQPGTRIGNYEVLSTLGAGGMGEVFRARDTKLGRDVAIKVLPEEFSRDRDKLARFEREARLLAALNHSNIATLYGLEEWEGKPILLMELIDGETLADRIARGPIPIDEAIPLFIQIAEGLEAAHEKGIIHRDLKPSNIKVTADRKVKVLDFGLAKFLTDQVPASDASKSPTVSRGGTKEGAILGSPAYMSPEQAQGEFVDRRTDIWSFGCVLYETLTGNRPFPGRSDLETMANVVSRDPDWSALPEATPMKIRDLIRRCLRKDPHRRLQHVGDARIEIDESLAEPKSTTRRPVRRLRAALVGFAALLLWTIAGGFGVWWIVRSPDPERRPISRFVVSLGPNEVLGAEGDPAVALSPDGSHLVYVAREGDQTRLYLRSLDQLQAKPISGSEGATTAFFSPDGRWVGFYGDNKVKKLPLDGGVPIALCDAPLPVGASWGSDGTIVFTPGDSSGLFRVSASGGTPQVVTTPDPGKGESSHRWPDVLPGGKAILFTIWTDGTLDNAEIAVVSLETVEQRVLVEGGSFARYVPTGHIVYARQGALLAVPFNLASLQVTGTPIPVLEDVLTDPRWGTASFGVSNDGSLVYVPSGLPERRLVWVDREGKVQPLTETRRSFSQPRLSPDGKKVAVTVEGPNPDVWVYEIARDTLTRLTFDRTPDSDPIWTPDGKRITFRSQRSAGWTLLSRLADGSGGEETLHTGPNNQFPSSWSPDGTVLAFMEFESNDQLGPPTSSPGG